MRPFWSGALSFGLINIPVKLYVASEEHGLDFDMLHKKDLSPIRYAKVCKEEEREVPYEEVVKGYEYEKGEYVVIEEEEFKKLNPKKTKTIDIQFFTSLSEIHPIYFARPYYVEPDKKGEKAFTLLIEALKASKKVALTRFVFRNKEHMGVVMPYEKGLLLMQLRFHSELRAMTSLNITKVKVETKEVQTAARLVEQLKGKFRPKQYEDQYQKELEEVIAAKLKGKKTKPKSRAPTYSSSKDLMHLLKQSLHASLKQEELKKPHAPRVSKKEKASKIKRAQS